MIIEPSPVGVDNKNVYVTSMYPNSGVFKHPTDSTMAILVNKRTCSTYCVGGYEEVLQSFLDSNKEADFVVGQVQTSNITAGDLLRAIAISQNPELATTSLHTSMQQ